MTKTGYFRQPIAGLTRDSTGDLYGTTFVVQLGVQPFGAEDVSTA